MDLRKIFLNQIYTSASMYIRMISEGSEVMTAENSAWPLGINYILIFN